MKTKVAAIFAAIAWFAIIVQYILMVEKSIMPILEITITFFSYFTIQVNTLVAIYFTYLLVSESKRPGFINAGGTLTALTVYITIVGCTYQILLRHVWSPQGMQLIVDELLHSVMPILVVIFWYLYAVKAKLEYSQMLRWSIYPLGYLFYVLIRGYFTDLYPYYFIDVNEVGLKNTLVTSGMLLLVFFAVSSIFIFSGKRITRNETSE